jgi:DNA-binding PadR family transcriptional regulator
LGEQGLSHVQLEILLSLAAGARHGYAIKQDIEAREGGDFTLGSGSLYQALQRLERRGLVAEDPGAPPSDDARRGRVYRIAPAGLRTLRQELDRMGRVVRQAGQIRALARSRT